jgi:uncharacterized protein
MKCPVDGSDLQVAERQGVEIDYCPTCRGVWLDRGELDKIIQRAAAYDAPPMDQRMEQRGTPPQGYDPRTDPRNQPPSQGYRRDDDDWYEHNRSSNHDTYYGHGKPKKKSFLSEVFDIFD